MTALRAPRLFDGERLRGPATVLLDGSRIAGLSDDPAATAEALPEGTILAPGFVDLQVNGGGGVMVNDALDPAGLARIAAAHARCGTTTIFPTLISGSAAAIEAAMAAVQRVAGEHPGIGGLHVEGPFFALARRGIHPAAAIRAITQADMAMLSRPIGVPVLLTLAPETVPAAAIAQLARAGVIVSGGHSDASFEQVEAGLDAGMSLLTHLFNAMSPFLGRAPGLVGAALHDRRAHAGIIVDGIHVHPAAVALAHAAMGPSRLFLVSDAMATAGSDIDGFSLYGTAIQLREGRLTDAAGTLAGAHLTMAEAVRNAVTRAGLPLADALRMATATPARCGRLPDRGRLAAGCRADMVALDPSLAVIGVWQGGMRL